MDSNLIYKQAHDLHYKNKDMLKALELYANIIYFYPDTQEAKYSETQIDNIFTSSPSKREEYQKFVTDLLNKYKENIENLSKNLDESINNSLKWVSTLSSKYESQFEYLICTVCSQAFYLGEIKLDAKLKGTIFNILGQLGWELMVATQNVSFGANVNRSSPMPNIEYVFKRVRQQSIEITQNEFKFFQFVSKGFITLGE